MDKKGTECDERSNHGTRVDVDNSQSLREPGREAHVTRPVFVGPGRYLLTNFEPPRPRAACKIGFDYQGVGNKC